MNTHFDVPEEAATLDAEVCEDGAVRFFYGGAVRDARARQQEGTTATVPSCTWWQ